MTSNSFPQTCFDYLNTHTLTGIKAGTNRNKFTPIWMVNVGKRIFARSWNKSLEGWMGEMLASGEGHIQFGDLILKCAASHLAPTDAIHTAIDEAYLEKYTQEENLFYAKGIVAQEYRSYTIEFLPFTEE